MAITRRQFVTRMGALAAAVGFSQADVSRLSSAFAGNDTAFGGTDNKPRVIWIHGAECTGCSTSLLSILEGANMNPIYGNDAVTLYNADPAKSAYNLAGINATVGTELFSLWSGTTNLIEGGPLMNIADVVIDVVDLQYHETVMSMGGDLAAKWLEDFVGHNTLPFVLVVEGAIQEKSDGGAWGDDAATSTAIPWCSIGCSDDFTLNDTTNAVASGFENDFTETFSALAIKSSCVAIIPIGQCAAYGGYPGCKPPITDAVAGKANTGFDPSLSQTGAMGVGAYLTRDLASGPEIAAAAKVINVPGCPTNPWWFVLTVVLFLIDYRNAGVLGNLDPVTHLPLASAVDAGGRLKMVYPLSVHSAWCPRYQYYVQGTYASKPGDAGCLQKLGCKGIATNSSCGEHGWNNQQPGNGAYGHSDLNHGRLVDNGVGGGGHCTQSGHPCMGCTEKGYPDQFVPFVNLNA
ncbi:MAG: hypothetical protein HGB10_05550 [Coriobacteriia bacterium]|nr:hypothetical protein [Coriobacteriia bacterium]